MPKNTVEYTICLTPVQNSSDTYAAKQDDWLNNSELNLLEQNSEIQNEKKTSLESLIENIPSAIKQADTAQKYSVKNFEIKTSINGPVLMTSSGEKLLKNNDLISINTVLYAINLTKIETISSESPIDNIAIKNSYNPFHSSDIWQDEQSHVHDQAQNHTQHKTYNQNHNKIPENNYQPTVQSDPLDFLYQPPQKINNTASLPYSQENSEDNSVNNQGNILSDLGINKETSVIVSQPLSTSASTYSDSSPMDMLDNFLDKPDFLSPMTSQNINHVPRINEASNHTNTHAYAPAVLTYSKQHEQKSTLLRGLKNAFKKLSL